MVQYRARESKVVCDTSECLPVHGLQQEVCVLVNAGGMTAQPKYRSNTLIKRLVRSTYNAGS